MPAPAHLRVAIDTGGTFTDCVYLSEGGLKVLKVFSTPADPSQAVLNALAQIASAEGLTPHHPIDVRHGTTVGTNAMLERKGARVAFVTTAGFEDTIAIGRQTRAKLYDWFAPIPIPLVPRELRFGVPERVTPTGEILRAPIDEELAALVEAVRASNAESIAISLLFGFANPATELRVEAALAPLGLPISTAHRILPEFREYERAATLVVNAYLAPRMQTYLTRLEDKVAAQHTGGRVDVMQSSGGIVSAGLAAREPVRTILSGPAGGVIGACAVARWAGFDRIVGFDMGGTSTDVFLADTRTGAQLTSESVIAGVPISVPMLDIHTAGAGGGSVARFDLGGMLRVGPESAGADPGPICFGRSSQPTVTDANLLLGRLDADSFLGGSITLDRARTERLMHEHKGPLATAVDFAAGILRVVESNMEKAIRVISVERGHDPRDCTLVAFGGGGPLHACALARALRIPRVLVPAMPGALSAVGILLADAVRDYSRTVMLPGDAIARLDEHFEELEKRALADFTAEGLRGTALRTLDIRYRRQGYELNVPFDPQQPTQAIAAFHQQHQQRYGFCDESRPFEIISLRLRMVAPAEPYSPPRAPFTAAAKTPTPHATRDIYFDGVFLPTPLYHREALTPGDRIPGPTMIAEYTSAIVLPPHAQADVDELGNLVITFPEISHDLQDQTP
jgi:N-methylhydantoinase A